jgi:hypothetical protein
VLENVESVQALAQVNARRLSRDELLWRLSDIVRRSGVDDAEILIRQLERHTQTRGS